MSSENVSLEFRHLIETGIGEDPIKPHVGALPTEWNLAASRDSRRQSAEEDVYIPNACDLGKLHKLSSQSASALFAKTAAFRKKIADFARTMDLPLPKHLDAFFSGTEAEARAAIRSELALETPTVERFPVPKPDYGPRDTSVELTTEEFFES